MFDWCNLQGKHKRRWTLIGACNRNYPKTWDVVIHALNRDAAFHVGRHTLLTYNLHPTICTSTTLYNLILQYITNNGRHRSTHNATPRASAQHSHHARTSTAHGRSPPASQSTPPAKPTTAIIPSLNTLPKWPNSTPNRRSKTASTHRSPIDRPGRPRQPKQWPISLFQQRHLHPPRAQIPKIR